MLRTQEKDDIALLYDSIRLAIESNNKEALLKKLSEVKNIEEGFLHNYTNRKEEGVYFTQKHISDFIVSQTLLEFFLSKGLNEKSLNEITPENEFILNIISKTTFCDPACGSGIFLLSLIDTLFNLIEKVSLSMDKDRLKYEVVKNISAFDINPNSVKLSILKLLKRILRVDFSNLKNLFKILENNITLKDVVNHPPSIKFDVIVGNPPYGNILDEALKAHLKEKKIFTNDIYCIFLSFAIQWSKGVIGFLVGTDL